MKGTPRLPARIQRRNAQFQQWQALLTNRSKRSRSGQMLIQGVRPLSQALEHGVELIALLVDDRPQRSRWARDILDAAPAQVVELPGELMAELGQRDEGPPELLGVAALPGDDLARLDELLRSAPPTGERCGPLVVFDRPRTPGNIGSLARSVDALGGAGLVITGHAADPFDPASIRSSTGSVFAVPVMRCASHLEVTELLAAREEAGQRWTVVGLDEAGGRLLSGTALSGQVVLVVGNETVGMSAGWREACDVIAEIPMGGSASSLNASVAGSIALYEAVRQRG